MTIQLFCDWGRRITPKIDSQWYNIGVSKKIIFLTTNFFQCRFLNNCCLEPMANLFSNKALVPETTRLFLGGVRGRFLKLFLSEVFRFQLGMVAMRHKYNSHQKYNIFLFRCKYYVLKLWLLTLTFIRVTIK